jgi:hypothetical protein
MTQVLYNYNSWEFWDEYNPDNDTFGTQNVTFDGPNRLILVNVNVTEVDVREDIYSNWKEWLMVGTNAQFAQAMTAVGGDPITNDTFVGITYFLENGWRIKPYAAHHILTINGNLYTREPGEDPYVVADGNFKVTVNTVRSNLIDMTVTSEGVGSTEKTQIDELHKLAGLQPDNPLVVTSTTRQAGPTIVQNIDGDDPVTVQRT